MGVHASGDGAAWDSLEALGVDQPHGLDYRESIHMAKAVRKRLSQEHALFADSTVGGAHTPGGSGVLMVDSTADMDTFAAAADLTSAHAYGIACCTEADATGATLFYFDSATSATTLPVSWNNIKTDVTHLFGAEITVGPPMVFQNTVDCSANLNVDSSADFSDVAITGDLSINGDFMLDGSFLPTSCASDFGGFLDEDGMDSDATASVASQQSIKKYVDDNIPVGSNPTANDSESNTMLKAHAYLAQTAGFVTTWASSTVGSLKGYVGTTTNPAGAGTQVAQNTSGGGTGDPFISFFVGNGKYFEITQTGGTVTILWTPLVSGGAAPIDQD